MTACSSRRARPDLALPSQAGAAPTSVRRSPSGRAPRRRRRIRTSHAPTQPTGLIATANSQTQVTLTWTASTDNVGVVGYHVFRNGAQIATLAPASPYVDSGVLANTSYAYQVQAVDAAGNLSALSNQATATTPAAAAAAGPGITFVAASHGASLGTSLTIPRPSGAAARGRPGRISGHRRNPGDHGASRLDARPDHHRCSRTCR